MIGACIWLEYGYNIIIARVFIYLRAIPTDNSPETHHHDLKELQYYNNPNNNNELVPNEWTAIITSKEQKERLNICQIM